METVIVNCQLIACYLFRRAFQKGGIQVAELDYQYIGELVLRAQEGDSDAFAELYVATYQQQYRFSTAICRTSSWPRTPCRRPIFWP